ncbi:hypothetical protein D3Z52_04610 [Clostridiaceae bacterium]|jgi:hypothetical protein|nr:hypothetical protein [Clostridiaceae bacterium]NBI80523.1 hypothetical protein [Clostridiaceae bacterium]
MPKRNDTKPWERQEGESVKAFEAFTVYLEMGDERSIREVAQRLAKSRTLIGRWSVTYQWVERVAAFDADVQRKAHAKAVKKRRNMVDRHISIALKMQEKALMALEQMDPADIDPKNLIAMLREATKLEQEMRTAAVDERRAAIADVEDTGEADDVLIYLPENGRD